MGLSKDLQWESQRIESMKSWSIINPDNEATIWYETQKDRILHRFPLPDEHGFVWLKTQKDAYPYVLDESVCVREYYHDRRFAGIVFFMGLIFSLVLGAFIGITGAGAGILISAVIGFIIGAPLKEDRHYYWRENEPAPIVFDEKITPGTVNITGKTIATYSKSEHLSRLVAPETNWVLVIVICVLVGIMAGAVGYSVGISNIPKAIP